MSFIDKLNPVFLREMRRAVRNGTMRVAFALFLVALLGVGVAAFSFASAFGGQLPADVCYRFFTLVFGGVAVVVIPIMVFLRHSSCVRVGSDDLMHLTILRPRQIADGMALAGIAGMLLALFLTFLVLLVICGVSNADVGKVLKLAAVLVGLSVAAIYYAVACGSMRSSAWLRIKSLLLGPAVLWCLPSLFGYTNALSLFGKAECVELLFMALFLVGLCSRLVAEGALSSEASNRYAPLHRTVAIVWAASFLPFLFVPRLPGLEWTEIAPEDGACTWAVFWIVAFGFLLLVSASSASLSFRFLKKPRRKGWWLSFLRVFLDGGAEHGMALWLLLMALSPAAVWIFDEKGASTTSFLAALLAFPPVMARSCWCFSGRKTHPGKSILWLSFPFLILDGFLTLQSLFGPGLSVVCVTLIIFTVLFFLGVYTLAWERNGSLR